MVALSYFCPQVVNVPDLVEGSAPVGGDDVVGSVLVHMVVQPDGGVDLVSGEFKIGRCMESSWQKPTQRVEHQVFYVQGAVKARGGSTTTSTVGFIIDQKVQLGTGTCCRAL